jgi:sugar/nucleoside kinase (ribokinase family)
VSDDDEPRDDEPRTPPEVVVVGAAARDVTDGDPRGWRLGGGVSYCALTTARLGVRTRAIVGVDGEASTAWELDLLRRAGAEVHLVALDRGPVFVNVERPEGRIQLAHERSDPMPVASLPPEGLAGPAWLLVPVAAELPPEWAVVPPADAFVAVGWQGLLRELIPGERVRRSAPRPEPILARADLVGVSGDDIERDVEIADLRSLLRPGASLVVTQGDRGGLVADGPGGTTRLRRYPAVRSNHRVDPTGAGDVFLAALTAARIQPRLLGGQAGRGFDLLLAAAAASLVIEGPGLLGVPDRAAVRERIAEARGAPAR